MQDEHREKLNKRLTPIHLYKLTPKTNCGECGFETCLAFATQIIVGQGDLESCPYLDQGALQPFRAQLAAQHESGIGVKREGFEKALAFLREQLEQCDFQAVAPSIGAAYLVGDSGPALEVQYFSQTVVATRGDITDAAGAPLDPWEKIFLYNYIIGGAVEPAAVWVGMESLPNSVSKIKSLKAHCEGRLAQAYAGKTAKLPAAIAGLGNAIRLDQGQADFGADFQILPKLTVRVLWWDEDPDEGFASRVKFLFDSNVLETLDLESLLFACENLTDRLLAAV